MLHQNWVLEETQANRCVEARQSNERDITHNFLYKFVFDGVTALKTFGGYLGRIYRNFNVRQFSYYLHLN